jgi:precorrin-6y C5,15-methyltransferase (decarboxylating) CbiE subunit
MAITPPPIALVGCGPGSPDYVTEAARRAVADADVILGSRRLLELFAAGAGQRLAIEGDVAAVLGTIGAHRAAGRAVAVLLSGDPGLFSLARPITEHFGAAHCRIIPGVSAVQAAFARLVLDWQDARILSAHGRTPTTTAEQLRGLDKLAILGGTAEALRWTAWAAGVLEASHDAYLCENLTLDDERVRAMTPPQLAAAAGVSSLWLAILLRRSIPT